MKIRIAGTANDSIVDGPGLRYVVFFQGCSHHCEGCQNPETWDFDKGEFVEVQDIIKDIVNNPLLTGVTLSGGDPFEHSEEAIYLLDAIKAVKPNLDIWAYTGYTFEELIPGEDNNPEFTKEIYLERIAKRTRYHLLQKVDVLVDGPYVKSLRDLKGVYKGSSNQRIIDVPASIRQKKIVEKIFDWRSL